MKSVEEEINQKIQEEKKEILNQGRKLKGKFNKIIKKVTYDYDLSEYDVLTDNNFWMVRLKKKGTIQTMKENIEKTYQENAAKERFRKRVKYGQIEQSISKWIKKEFKEDYRVEHSRSILKSESFYIVNEGEKIIKLSLHNTAGQEFEHNTSFIDLNGYTSTTDLKRDIKQKINIL